MTSGEAQARIAALERQVREMAARPNVSGPMVSHHSGRTEIRPWQVGFPAELTSTYSSTTGYDWKQLLLVRDSSPQVEEDPDGDPLEGDQAHTPGNDATLAVGTRGWLEPDRQAGGWIFTPSVSPRLGWFARLTSVSGGAWKWVQVQIDSGGSWADVGSESASYNAYPSLIDDTLTCNPMPDMRVWMWTGLESGKYEFMVVLSPPLLCEVTAYDGTTKYHTVKQVTWETTGDTITDYSPATSYTKCVSTTETQIANATRVLMWKIPDRDGEHWIMSAEGGGGSSAITHDHDRGFDNYIISTTTSWANILLKSSSATPLVLPGHGDYQMWFDFTVQVTATDPSFAGNGDIGVVRARWYNATNSVAETDYFAACSRLTTDQLNPSGSPQATVWTFKVADVDVVEVTQGSNANKDFHLQADVTIGGTAGCTLTISEIRVGFLKLS